MNEARAHTGKPGPLSIGSLLKPHSKLIALGLPALPPECDYRLMGHDLVLRDAKTNLIVDIVPDAIT